MIRLYRNYDPNLSNCPVQMVSAFRGLNEVIQMKRGTGVITDWKQNGGTLMVGGDSRIIRVWDAHLESQIMVGFSTVSREPSLKFRSLHRTWTRTPTVQSQRSSLTVDRRRCSWQASPMAPSRSSIADLRNMPWSGPINNTCLGSKTSSGILPLPGISCLRGMSATERACLVACFDGR